MAVIAKQCPDLKVTVVDVNQESTKEFLLEGSDDGSALARETLYMELRYKGKPVDPSLWFAVNDS